MKRLITFFVIALTVASCCTTSKFVYLANPRELLKITDMPKYNFTVAVLPFEEMRKDKNQAATAWISWIPGVPYGFVTYSDLLLELVHGSRVNIVIVEVGRDGVSNPGRTIGVQHETLQRLVYGRKGGCIGNYGSSSVEVTRGLINTAGRIL